LPSAAQRPRTDVGQLPHGAVVSEVIDLTGE
jgi:hypothetical protein